MLKITEFLDIDKIEELRKRCLNKDLDDFDNFSYHIALIDEEKLYGVARLYKKDGAVVLDNVALEKFAEDNHYEMLFRALLLKAISINCKYITAEREREIEFYLKFNFDSNLKAEPEKIVFPKICGDCAKN